MKQTLDIKRIDMIDELLSRKQAHLNVMRILGGDVSVTSVVSNPEWADFTLDSGYTYRVSNEGIVTADEKSCTYLRANGVECAPRGSTLPALQYEAVQRVLLKIKGVDVLNYTETRDGGDVAVTLKSGRQFYVYKDGSVYAGSDADVSFLREQGITCYFLPLATKDTPKAQDRQVGGNHYASMKIQPWTVMRAVFTRDEMIGYHIGTVMAYLMRHKAKGGEQDIKKAQHHLTELVEYLESENATTKA